jgi:hypothetical protein
MDVFIGHLCDPMKFGVPMSSYLYINDGKGKFTIGETKQMNLLNVGMVTSASFTDLNNDSWPDLVIAGEWMPVKVFMNNRGVFTASELPASSGLWQSVYTTDINGDGFTDILAGNWGTNSKYAAGKNGPLKLYVKDFDNNGTFEQIVCYTIDGKEYPFLAKDELERELPVLKKAYLTYSEVAGKTVQYMFYDLFKEFTEYKAEVLSSSYFLNDGKGNFTRTDLPVSFQLAPLFSFYNIGKAAAGNEYIAGGNFYDVTPYEGRYDALSLGLFAANGSKISALKQTDLCFRGQTRDIKKLHTAAWGDIIVVAPNNGKLQFFK